MSADCQRIWLIECYRDRRCSNALIRAKRTLFELYGRIVGENRNRSGIRRSERGTDGIAQHHVERFIDFNDGVIQD